MTASEQSLGHQSIDERARTILESITDAFFSLSRDWRFNYANPQSGRILGRTASDLVGKNVWDEYPGLRGSVFEPVYRRAMTEGVAGSITAFYPDHARWYEVRTYPAPDGISIYFRNVTEEKRAEDALRLSEERRRLVLDSAELGSWNIDPATSSMTCDERFCEIFGIPPDHCSYEEAFAAIHPADRQKVRAGVQGATRPVDPVPYECEYRVVHPDGSIRWVFAKGRANFMKRGTGDVLMSFDGTVADVTDRKQGEQVLRDARDAAEAASVAKDRFLAVLSHELRTPLSPVVMTVPALELDPDMPLKFREDLAMIRRNIDLEVKLIDDLLDLSRVTSGKLRLQMQPVQVHEVLRHAIQNSLSDTSGKGMVIREEFNAGDDCVTGDPARLQQVFWNLLRNAVKFTPAGGAITVRTYIDGKGFLAVQVRDSGGGIEPEILPRIFDAFEQGEVSITRQFGGLGLGLAIVKAVVEMHGGTVTAESDGRDKGAAFTVRLMPPTRVATETNRDTPPEHASQTPAGVRVLLVEDHPDTARTLARLLKFSGFRVKTAGSAATALQLAGSESFDVVVSDIGLPDATGYELMAQLRERHGLKGIALTGYGMEDDMRKSREVGFLEHIVKPVNVSQLEATIQRVAKG